MTSVWTFLIKIGLGILMGALLGAWLMTMLVVNPQRTSYEKTIAKMVKDQSEAVKNINTQLGLARSKLLQSNKMCQPVPDENIKATQAVVDQKNKEVHDAFAAGVASVKVVQPPIFAPGTCPGGELISAAELRDALAAH